MRLNVQLMQFKHTGVFPEQAVNWLWIRQKLKNAPRARVLNLFAYTGAATVAAALAGATVCHVDSARGIVQKAKENAAMSRVPAERTRYIIDDVQKFVAREIRRGNKYDAVIMDPPAYGRGPGGELWQVETGLFGLVSQCCELLSSAPVFFLISSYAAGVTPATAENVLALSVASRFGGHVSAHELGLLERARGIALPCGCCARWEA
jgi:23S rRNA (cytosine1962-C5)-methyltransferase